MYSFANIFVWARRKWKWNSEFCIDFYTRNSRSLSPADARNVCSSLVQRSNVRYSLTHLTQKSFLHVTLLFVPSSFRPSLTHSLLHSFTTCVLMCWGSGEAIMCERGVWWKLSGLCNHWIPWVKVFLFWVSIFHPPRLFTQPSCLLLSCNFSLLGDEFGQILCPFYLLLLPTVSPSHFRTDMDTSYSSKVM